MRTVTKAALAAVLSAAIFATIAQSALANRLGLNESTRRVTFSPLSIIPSFGSTVRCPVTLEETYHSRTIVKASDALVGYIVAALSGTCTAGAMRWNTETLPWHRTHRGFRGVLPNITDVTEGLTGASLVSQNEIFGLRVNCQYDIASLQWIYRKESRGAITEEHPELERIASATGGCPEAQLSGFGTVTTGTGRAFVLTLV